MKRKLNVLILFECSGVSREAFRKLGHNAWSIDLQPADDKSPHHMQADAVNYLKCCRDDGGGNWDLIIMHPPCTALALSGNRWYGKGKPKHAARIAAVDWTIRVWKLAIETCNYVALENPVGVLGQTEIGKATQYVQPWQFGHGETKRTGLWLYNLPALQPTNIVDGREQRIWKLPPSDDRAKIRSKTFQGIAEAWAVQWSEYVTNAIHDNDIQNIAYDAIAGQLGDQIAF